MEVGLELVAVAAAVVVAGATGKSVVAVVVAADADVDLSAAHVVVGVCACKIRWCRADDLPAHDGRLDFCLRSAFVLDRPAAVAAIDESDTEPELLPDSLVSAAAGWDEGEASVSWEAR